MTLASLSADLLTRGAESPDLYRDAFTRLEDAIRAVPRRNLRAPNIDLYRAAQLVLRSAPRFMALRPRMLKLGDELDMWLVDNCADLARAFCYASSDYVVHDAAHALPKLRREATLLRGKLRASMELVHRAGLVQGELLMPLRNRSSYLAISHDLTALERFFRDHWDVLSLKVAVSEADLQRAGFLAASFLQGAVQRRERSEAVKARALVAQQAFTLLCRAYDEVRRAVSFLRWREGDAEAIAPSLYAGRNTGGRLPRVSEAPKKDDAAESEKPSASEQTSDPLV